MGTKVKGLLKGLRYISQIFDEQKKEPEMQIGLPTDVKHVAHIGWDGPSADSPSWLEGFKTQGGGHQSSPQGIEVLKENLDVKLVSEDSKRRDQPDVPRSTRRLSGKKKSSSSSSGTSSPRKEKSRHSRRHHLKDSESSKLNRVGSAESDESSPARDLNEVQKKSRRRKSSKSRRGSSSGGSGFVTCGSDPEVSFKSSNSTKEDKQSSEAC